ncbi:Protein phosphatase 2C 2 [Ophidiomyces ophidiicola]|nr:Protein phosphatase 2C 2 [Ophidiomyces ophidiicola]
MGQTLSEPVVEKNSEDGADECVIYGLSAMQGWRISMEDAHSAVLDLEAKYITKDQRPTDPSKRMSFFGVYDGHGGDQMALYAGFHVPRILASQEAFARGDVEQALKDGFLATDRAILEGRAPKFYAILQPFPANSGLMALDPHYEEEVSGCTAAVAVVSREKIRVANAGDSRTVLGIKGRAKPLSFDHKPQNEGEKARITAAGGYVDFGRVNGNLALSRALGDFEFKKTPELSPEQQIVTAFPDVTTHEVTEDDEFIVIACDGIWDCRSSQAVIEFVRRGIVARQPLDRICENLMDNCLASNSETGGVGCDNMTMVIIGLLQGKTKDEWYQMIADRVEKGEGPCAPPEYAQFRGPGSRHQFDDNSEEYDPGLDTRRSIGRTGRIILLGDGTELLTDMGNDEMFGNEEESSEEDFTEYNGTAPDSETPRQQREGTPAPQINHTPQINGNSTPERNEPSTRAPNSSS